MATSTKYPHIALPSATHSPSPLVSSPQRSSSSSIRLINQLPPTRITLPESATRRLLLTASGSQTRPASPIACPPKLNGSTPSARARKLHSSPATLRPRPARPTPGESSWAKAHRSGSPTGTVPTHLQRKPIPLDPRKATSASFAAAASTFGNRNLAKFIPRLHRTSCVLPIAPAWRQHSHRLKATSASASCRRPHSHPTPRQSRRCSSSPT